MAAEMARTTAPPSSRRLAIVADTNAPRRPGGCGVFFLLLDWNRRLSRKKRRISPPKLPIAEESGGGLIAREEKMGSPNLVARLMGLESVPPKCLRKARSDPSTEVCPPLKEFYLTSSGVDRSASRRSTASRSSSSQLTEKKPSEPRGRSIEKASVSGGDGDLKLSRERNWRKKTAPDFLGVLLEKKVKELSHLGKDETVAGVLEELISALTYSPFSEPEVIKKNVPPPSIEEPGEIFERDVLDGALEVLVDFFPEMQSKAEAMKRRKFLYDCISEYVDFYYNRRAWPEMPFPGSEMLAYKVNGEMGTWGKIAGKGLDEIVRWDLNRTAENWAESDSEAFVVGVDIGNIALEVLVDEMVHDLASCSVNSRSTWLKATRQAENLATGVCDVGRCRTDRSFDLCSLCR